jgi:hypothetical protein
MTGRGDKSQNRPEECLWTALHVLVEPDLPSLIQDADRHAAGTQIDTARRRRIVQFGVESPEISSSCGCLHAYQRQHIIVVCGGGGLNKYQTPAADWPTADGASNAIDLVGSVVAGCRADS